MSERVTDEMVKRAALAVSDQLDGGYRGHSCAEHDEHGRGCERCREIARAALTAALAQKPTHLCLDCGAVGWAGGYHDHGSGNAGDTAPIADVLRAVGEAGEVADERDELRVRVAELEKAVRRYRGASQLYAMVLGGGWMRTAAGRRREQDARRELRAACDALDALLPDAEDRGQ